MNVEGKELHVLNSEIVTMRHWESRFILQKTLGYYNPGACT